MHSTKRRSCYCTCGFTVPVTEKLNGAEPLLLLLSLPAFCCGGKNQNVCCAFRILKLTSAAAETRSVYTLSFVQSQEFLKFYLLIFQVARDRVVKGWNFAENLGEVDSDYGSGYPNGNRNNQQLL